MKLYAAFGEYGDIWPTTIRYSEAETIEALKRDPCMEGRPNDLLFSGGVSIGSFNFNNGIFGTGTNGWPKPETVTWLYGYRANKRKDGP